jgi:hypothetical protein
MRRRNALEGVMIKHMVAFRFKPDVTEDEQASMIAELNDFPNRFSAMKRWSLGRNSSRRDDTFTHGFTVEFDREENCSPISTPKHTNTL